MSSFACMFVMTLVVFVIFLCMLLSLVVLLLGHGGDHGVPGREHLDGGGAPGARGGLEARELARGPLVEGPLTQLRLELGHKAGHRQPADEAVDHGRQHGAARAEERGGGDADAEAQPAATVADRHAEPLPREIVGQDQRPGLAEGVARRARDGRVEVREEDPGRRHVQGLSDFACCDPSDDRRVRWLNVRAPSHVVAGEEVGV